MILPSAVVPAVLYDRDVTTELRMWIMQDQAVVMFARYCRARFAAAP
jgi:hypothetical protein